MMVSTLDVVAFACWTAARSVHVFDAVWQRLSARFASTSSTVLSTRNAAPQAVVPPNTSTPTTVDMPPSGPLMVSSLSRGRGTAENREALERTHPASTNAYTPPSDYAAANTRVTGSASTAFRRGTCMTAASSAPASAAAPRADARTARPASAGSVCGDDDGEARASPRASPY